LQDLVSYGVDTRGGEVLCYVCQYSAGGDYGCVEGAGGADGGDAGEGYRGDGGFGNGNLTALARAIGAVGYDNEMMGLGPVVCDEACRENRNSHARDCPGS